MEGNKKQKKKASGVAPMKRDATNEEATISPDEPKTMNITDVIPKTKTKKKKTLGRPMNDNIRSVIDAFVEHIKTIGIQGLRGEFVEIRNMKPKASECTKFLQNREKNRYRDVACLDSTRVVLRVNVPPECDYIHANWMQMEGCQRRYIATQGPLETTIGDFWRMIYQESIKTIVMLCKLVENGKVKCSQYWPDLPGTHKSFSILTIENKGITTERKFTVYNLRVSKGDDKNSMNVKLIQMCDWPDRAVPTSGYAVLRLIRMIPTKGACVIHCSAGIGRTGTIVAIDTILQRLWNARKVNVKDIVVEMRKQRCASVQNEAQYIFIFTTALDYIRAKLPNFATFVDDFHRQVAKANIIG
uniref:Tyrosine-protein phosphatase non-receptor type 9 n=1 Tax=Ascaris suum TaxID=6253 RepID=F1LA26_ASCSU